MDRSEAGGHLSALVTIVIWGTTFISTKVLLGGMSPVEILFIRFAIGFAALFLYRPHIFRFQGWRAEGTMALAGLCGICLYYLMENVALTYTLASNVGIIISLSPFFTALISGFILHEGPRPGLPFFAGFILAMAGIVLLNIDGSGLDSDLTGNLLALGAAFVWSIYSILSRKIATLNLDVIQTTRRTFAYGLVFMIPFLISMDFAPDAGFLLRPGTLLNLAFLSLGASALCFVTWNHAVSVLGAVATSVYIYLVPVVTVLCSIIILGEAPTALRILGCLLTLAGLGLSQHCGRR